jgi:thiol oxidase
MISAWRTVAEVAVVDCANFDNNPLCRNLEIMSYPTIRAYAPHTKSGELGIDLVNDKTVSGIKNSLIDFMEKEQGKGTLKRPIITPYR